MEEKEWFSSITITTLSGGVIPKCLFVGSSRTRWWCE